MKTLLILPIVIPLVTAICSLLGRKNRVLQRRIGVAGIGLLLVSALALMNAVWRHGVLAVQMGSWPAPFGITLVADTFSAIMVVLVGIVGFATAIYSAGSVHRKHESFGYYALLSFLLMGVCGAFLTGDLFNLYVWFEVMLISSFVLLVLGGGQAQMEGAIKYVTLNLLSSSIFLAAVGITYGLTGTLNMADLSGKFGAIESSGVRLAVSMLFLVAFGIKAAVFPLFFWLPASYHTPPAAVSAVFAGLLTKVGVYALIRVFTLLFVDDVELTHGLITVIAGLTMLTGVLGAAAQHEFRRILSFHIVSQIGYMIMGLGLFTPAALAGSVFYIVHHIIVKTNLFLVSGVANRLRGTYELERLGGLYRSYPFLALLFMIPAMSLAGIPPLSGFFAKFALIRAGLEIEQYAIVATALFVGLLTLFSMTKIWSEAFWKPAPEGSSGPDSKDKAMARYRRDRQLGPMIVAIVALAALTVSIGLAAGPLMAVAYRAAEELLDRRAYIEAVMGVGS
jgi:multicomponent Na+:H+ antiporter subunit D